MKQRLDQKMVQLGLVTTRSQAESYIKLGEAKVDDKMVTKPGFLVGDEAKVELTARGRYVSRAALKLASIAEALRLDFKDKVVLDVGSSTGGFTDYALQHRAKRVIAVEVGTGQLHPSLRGNPRIELHEKTDIRDVRLKNQETRSEKQESRNKRQVNIEVPDLVLADVSFVSLRELLPHISSLVTRDSPLVCMVKPQFEAGQSSLKHKGVIKNDKMRREILRDFEGWVQDKYIVVDKADSEVAGAKGNRERFYLLKKL